MKLSIKVLYLHVDDATDRLKILKKYMPIICNLAQPVTMATELYSKGMITQFTKDQAIQVTGMVNYEKNVHLLNEVEKVIKNDISKLAVFGNLLQNIPTLKYHGNQLLQEAGLSNAIQCSVPIHVLPLAENATTQHDQSVYVDYDIATDIMCLETKYFRLLDSTKAVLHISAIPTEQIQFVIERHIGTGINYSMSPTLDSLFKRLKNETSFLDYAIIAALVQTYITDFTVKNECKMYIQEVKQFCNSTTLAELKKDCEKTIALLPDTKKVLLIVDKRWDEVTITSFKRLLEITFHNMVTHLEVTSGSLVITGIILDHRNDIIDIVTSWVHESTFMKAIGVLLVKVGDTVIYEAPEQEHTSITLEEGLSTALQSGNVLAVELQLAVSIDTHPLSHTLISKAVAMRDSNGYTVLHSACRWGHDDVLQLLLEYSTSADIDFRTSVTGTTALILATQYEHIEIVRILLEKGADINIQTATGDTAISVATKNHYQEITSLLLRHKVHKSFGKGLISNEAATSCDDSVTDKPIMKTVYSDLHGKSVKLLCFRYITLYVLQIPGCHNIVTRYLQHCDNIVTKL